MHQWTEAELAELENFDEADLGPIEHHEPAPDPHAILQVRFSLAELHDLQRAADRAGLSVLAYVHAAALAHARVRAQVAAG